MCFLKLSLYMPAKPFQNSLLLYYGYSHAHGHVYIPNLVHNSLDVQGWHHIFFYTITNFVIEMTSGHIVTLTLG